VRRDMPPKYQFSRSRPRSRSPIRTDVLQRMTERVGRASRPSFRFQPLPGETPAPLFRPHTSLLLATAVCWSGQKHFSRGSRSRSPARHAQNRTLIQALLYCLIFVMAPANARRSVASSIADDSDRPSSQQLNEAALNRQIESVLEQPEFDWRRPNTNQLKPSPQLERLLDSIRQAAFSFGGAVDGILRWLLSLFREKQIISPDGSVGIPFSNRFLTALACLLALAVAGTATLFFLRVVAAHRQRQAKPAIAQREPDSISEGISANQLSDDAWYALARQKIDAGELRQGQRAIFLAILSCLGSRRLIGVAGWKSNHDYEIELRRRAKHLPELARLYAESRIDFERCWYGEYNVTRADLERYGMIYERIKDATA
jgi:hypothetical protein